MDKKIEARKTLTKMYEGFLIAGICTCWLNEYAEKSLLTNISKILKDAEVDFYTDDVERCIGCLDSKKDWESVLDYWFR